MMEFKDKKKISEFTDEELAKELRDRDKAVAIWGWEDAVHQANELGIECTEEEGRMIMNQVDHRHDCVLGITWDTLEYYVGELETQHEDNDDDGND
jgi:hypothetical protein